MKPNTDWWLQVNNLPLIDAPPPTPLSARVQSVDQSDEEDEDGEGDEDETESSQTLGIENRMGSCALRSGPGRQIIE